MIVMKNRKDDNFYWYQGYRSDSLIFDESSRELACHLCGRDHRGVQCPPRLGDWSQKRAIETLYQQTVNDYLETKPKKTLMSRMRTTIKNITRTEPNKTFVKAGFLDENENITHDGFEALYHILWNQNEEKLKALAEEVIKEQEK